MKVLKYNEVNGFRKTVTISEVLVGTTDTALKAFAMEHAKETPTSIFGSVIKRPTPSTAVVTLHTS